MVANFNVCQALIENSFDKKWSTYDFINISKHIFAVIEDTNDLFSLKVRFIVQLALQQHVKNLILLLIADQSLWTFGLLQVKI